MFYFIIFLSVCTLKPLSDVFAMVRNPDDQQSFAIEFLRGGTRSYRATERDALLATLLDGVRSSGNRDIHVRSTLTNRALRLTPLRQAPDEEVSYIRNIFNLNSVIYFSYFFIFRLNLCTCVGWSNPHLQFL